MRTLILLLALIAAPAAMACQPWYCQPRKSLGQAATDSAFVAVGTIFEGHLEIEKIWKGKSGPNWSTSVAFDAYRCCDLYKDALEGSRWLIVSMSYPPKAIMSEHSQLLPASRTEEKALEDRLTAVLGSPRGPTPLMPLAR